MDGAEKDVSGLITVSDSPSDWLSTAYLWISQLAVSQRSQRFFRIGLNLTYPLIR